MPYARPTLTELYRQATDDLRTGPGGDGMGLLRWAVSGPLAWALSNAAAGQYGYLDWIARQSVPFTATGEHLEAWAALVGVLRKPAAQAVGTWTGTGAPGAVLPVGTPVSGQPGVGYLTTAQAVVGANGTVTAPILAVSAGAAGNAPAGAPLQLASAVEGVNSNGGAGAAVSGGVGQEDDDSLRTRMLLRWAEPPKGGAQSDYLEWALAVPGVTRAWVNPLGAGDGTVVIYTMWDTAEAARGGFPQGSDGVAAAEWRGAAATGEQLAVADALYPLRPATALVYSCAPVAYPVAFAIQTPAAVPAAKRAAVAAALAAVFLGTADATGGTLAIGPFDAAITGGLGTAAFTVTQPAQAVTAPMGQLPVLDAVTWSVAGG